MVHNLFISRIEIFLGISKRFYTLYLVKDYARNGPGFYFCGLSVNDVFKESKRLKARKAIQITDIPDFFNKIKKKAISQLFSKIVLRDLW